MIEFLAVVAAWFLVGLVSLAYVFLAPRPAAPPRHARPKGWQGPPNRAPFPIVADPQEGYGVWPFLIQGDRKGGDLSPLNREVLRTRLRVDMSEALGRPIV